MKTSLAGVVNIVLVAVISKSRDLGWLFLVPWGASGTAQGSWERSPGRGRAQPCSLHTEIRNHSFAKGCRPARGAGGSSCAQPGPAAAQEPLGSQTRPAWHLQLSKQPLAPPNPEPALGWEHKEEQSLQQAPEERRFRIEKLHLKETASSWTPNNQNMP